MNAPATHTALPPVGTPLEGGFFAGTIRIDGVLHGLLVSPKDKGEHESTELHDKAIDGTFTYNDGVANTNALAQADNELAKWAQELEIDGFKDWYLPSQDELEVIYRNLKPGENENYTYNRSGMNLHAENPTLPYTRELPAQTHIEVFKEGGAEAFEQEWYWSSSVLASDSGYAWVQGFSSGGQHYNHVDGNYRARAVRRFVI